MDLKHAIADFKHVERFLKGLTKIIQHLELLDSLEKQVVELTEKVKAKENKIVLIEEQVKAAGNKLTVKKENVATEIESINASIQEDKTKVIAEYDATIVIKKSELEVLEERSRGFIVNNKTLKQENDSLKTQVNNLKSVIGKTESSLASV